MHNIQTVTVKPINVKSSVTFRLVIFMNPPKGFSCQYKNVTIIFSVRDTPNC